MTSSEIRDDVNHLLQRLPQEIQLDLENAASRFRHEQSLKQKVSELLVDNQRRERILQELFDCGPLSDLLADESVTEILVNGPSSIWFERDGRFFEHNDQFISAFTLSQFIQRICVESRLRIDLNQPFVDGTWRGMRIHIAQAPLVDSASSVCLRRHPQQSWTLSELERAGWAGAHDIEKLKKLLAERSNMMIVGPTGAGKTSVLSALLADLPFNERVVILEDTSEIKIPNGISVKLLTRIDLQGNLRSFDQSDLVKQSLRMRPSRLVVGEVRGGEAKDLLLALSTGHSGSLGTLHASSARQALLRLEMLVQMGAPQWSLETVRQLILQSLNILVVTKMQNGRRSLDGIYRICSLEKCGFLIEKMSETAGAINAPALNTMLSHQ